MAESFAIDTGQTPQRAMTQAPQMQGPGGGVQFSDPGLAGRAAAAQAKDPTNALLMKMAGAALAPKVDAETKAQFFQGMQRAMAGEAVKDIVDSTPWWANTFGQSAAVLGAQHYAKEATVARWAAGVAEQMPELAKQDPSQVGNIIYGQLQEMFTGDSATDGNILASAVDMMAPILKQQAKAHVAYTNNRANEEQLNSWGAQAELLQSMMSDPTSSPEDREYATQRLMGQIAPLEGQTEESYQKNIAALIKGTAERGQFGVIAMLKNTAGEDGVAVWDKLPYSARTQMDAAMPQYARQAINDALPRYGLELELLVNNTAQDPRKIKEAVDAFNQKVALETGVPVNMAQAIPTSQLLQMTGNVLRAQAAQAAAGKDDAAMAGLAKQLATKPGQLASYKALGFIQDKHAEEALAGAWGASPDPKARAGLLNANPTIKSDIITANIMSDLGSGLYSDAVLLHAETFKNLDEAGVSGYPTAIAAKLSAYNTKVAEGWAPEQAWEMAPQFVSIGKSQIKPKNRSDAEKAIVKAVQKENPWLSTMVGDYGNELTKSSLNVAYAVMAKDLDNLGSGAGIETDKAAASAYYRAIKTNTMQVYGKHATSVANPNLAAPLGNFVPGTQKETAQAFDDVFKAKAKAAGIPTDDYFITRMPDQGGKAYFGVNAIDDKGKPHNFMLSSDEITTSLNVIRKKEAPPDPGQGWQDRLKAFGNQGRVNPR